MTRKQRIHALKRQHRLKQLALLAAATASVGAVSLSTAPFAKAEETTPPTMTTEPTPPSEKETGEDTPATEGTVEVQLPKTGITGGGGGGGEFTLYPGESRTPTPVEGKLAFIHGPKGLVTTLTYEDMVDGEHYSFIDFTPEEYEEYKNKKHQPIEGETGEVTPPEENARQPIVVETGNVPINFDYVEENYDDEFKELKRVTLTIQPGETLTISPEKREGLKPSVWHSPLFGSDSSQELIIRYLDVKQRQRDWGKVNFTVRYKKSDSDSANYRTEYDEAKARELHDLINHRKELAEKALEIDPDDYTSEVYRKAYPYRYGYMKGFRSILARIDTLHAWDRGFASDAYKVEWLGSYDHDIQYAKDDISVLESFLADIGKAEKIVNKPKSDNTTPPSNPVTPPSTGEGTTTPSNPVTPPSTGEGTTPPNNPVTPPSTGEGTTTPSKPVTPPSAGEGTTPPSEPVTPPSTGEGTTTPSKPVTPPSTGGAITPPSKPTTGSGSLASGKPSTPSPAATTSNGQGQAKAQIPASQSNKTEKSQSDRPVTMTDQSAKGLPATGEATSVLGLVGLGLMGLAGLTSKKRREG